MRIKSVLKGLSIFLIAVLLTLVVYRYQIQNGFSYEFGDRYDDIIEISILEHWYNVIFGHESWLQTQFFYPYEKTIGYSDGFFLFGVVYSFVRFVGVGPILSNEIVGMIFHIIGYMSFYLMLRTVWKFKKLASFFAAAVICLSNNMWTESMHLQLYVVYLVPIIVIMFYNAWNFLEDNKICNAWLSFCVGCFVYGACLMTGFYLIWFFTFFSLLFFLVYICNSSQRHLVFSRVRPYMRLIPPAFCVMLISVFPLLYVYLGKARETGMQSWAAVRHFILPLTALINIGKNNIAYHWVMIHIPDGSYNRDVEFSVALTPILVLCILYTIFSKRFSAFSGRNPVFWRALFLAIVISVFLSIHVGKFYPWYVVYHLVPGAKSMRAVSRFMLFLSYPVSVIFALFLDKLQCDGRKLLATVVGFLVLCEQLNAAPVISLDRAANDAFYASLPSPSPMCKSFFIIGHPPQPSDNDEEGVYEGNVPAMLYAELHHIPTVNGFTTFYPRDWHFDHPYLPDIRQRAQYYARTHHIEQGFCALNLVTKKWEEEPFK